MKKTKILIEEKSVVVKTVSYQNVVAHRPLLNVILLLLVGLLGIWYALWVNFVISGQYRESLLEKKLAILLDENDLLLSEKSDSANLGALLVFSKQAGLVEQKNIEYLFDRRNVAEIPRNLAQ
ncbi:MAG: hypothetical protein G01um101444_436 [Parcubacteria group bacterium Gr01-1014_44]|nr:MAG: hypothetical protein G01um101444_436 [Parcubacteria group bacterium Gr01-1014_44]